MIFIDEVGYNLSMRRVRGESYAGLRANAVVKIFKIRNINICAAMSKNVGILQKEKMPYNTSSFKGFIIELENILADVGIENLVLIMDNVLFHKSNLIKNFYRKFFY
ncbi:hypothetical protein DMUE_3478 [Dictyocoela muelleri]|nr:hypothetical protein DMUE_3478 [Dictyocoela muelleri]